MHDNRATAEDDFWCPLDDAPGAAVMRCVELSPIECETLSRIQHGDWIAETVVHLFETRGLVTRAFGSARLTPAGEAALEAYSCPGV